MGERGQELVLGAIGPLGFRQRLVLGGQQARVADGHRRVAGQAQQHALVAIGEGPRHQIADIEQAADALVDADRHHQCGDGADLAGGIDIVFGEAGVGPVVVGPERPAGLHHAPAHTAAALDATDGLLGRSHPRAHGHRLRQGGLGVLGQRDGGRVARGQLARRHAHALQHGVDVERGADRARQLGHHLGLAPAIVQLALGRLALGDVHAHAQHA